MTTLIYLDNYRGFNDTYIPLSQVNFLVGENSTGKTSFLELLEMFFYPPFWILEPRYGAPGSQQRHFLDLVSAASKSKKQFTVGAICAQDSRMESAIGLIVTYINLEGRAVIKRMSRIDKTSIRTLEGKLWISKAGEKYKDRTKEIQYRHSSDDFICAKKLVSIHKSSVGFTDKEVTKDKHGSPLFIRCDDSITADNADNMEVELPRYFSNNYVSLAPIRTKPKRTYDAPQTIFSPEGEHTPYVIKKRLGSKSQAADFASFLKKIGSESGLFESIAIKSYGSGPLAPFEIRVSLGRAALGLENVGYGVSQALPVIVEMFIRGKNSVFSVQQPEVHLHPKAQASIGDLIAEFARNEEKSFVVETHSDFTIDRFRLNVRRNGKLSSQLLFFEKTESGNKVTPIKINENGMLDDKQPNSYRSFFFNESLSLLS